MRKISLMLLTAIMAVTVGAQPQMLKKTLGIDKPAAALTIEKNATRQVLSQADGLLHEQPMAAAAPKASAENTPVVPPADLVTQRYRLNGYIMLEGWETVSRTVDIGFDGNDVYVHGFMHFLPDAWIKGTLSSDHSTVTFPMQFVGNLYNSNGELRDVYFWPAMYADGGWHSIDAVFNYNEDVGTFMLTQEVVTYIFENTLVDGLRYFAVYDTVLSMTDDSDTVEVPDGLVTQECQFSGMMMELIDEENVVWSEYEAKTSAVSVAYDDDYCYIQGLCPYIPGAWAKGKRGEGNTFTFENGQYFGVYIFMGEAYPIYLVGYNADFGQAEDIVMTLDEATGTLTTGQWVSMNAIPDDMWAYEVYSNVVITPVLDVAAVPATPEVTYFEYDADLEMAMAEFAIPATDVDGTPLLVSKLYYQVYTDYGQGAEPYTFEAEWHEGLDDDMTLVPYSYEDDIDFLSKGELVIFYTIRPDIKRIGVKSIYTGGGQTNESEISWWLVDESYNPDETTGIAEAKNRQKTSVVYYDLQGRKATADTKGLLLKQTQQADGSVKTVKVVR